VYGEVMRAYIVDNNLTTTNKFWMFDKLPNQLHSSELGIQTSGQQQPVSEGTKKITMNGLRSIVKQIIKEETMLNEDNLVLNNYAKQLYSLFKQEEAKNALNEILKKYGNQVTGTVETKKMDYDWAKNYAPTYSILIRMKDDKQIAKTQSAKPQTQQQQQPVSENLRLRN
jgi:hypothetical protein